MTQTNPPWYHGKTRQEIASSLRQIRTESDITQEQLATILGSSRATISRLERDQDVSLELAVKAFRALGYQLVAVPFGSRVQVSQDE